MPFSFSNISGFDMSTSNLHLLPPMAPDISLSTQVQDVIMEGIQTGILAPGQRLLVDEVALNFGVSKIPVREAFKALETGGWLESRPRRGTFVKTLSAKELESIFEMRRVLEPQSAALAAERRTPDQLKALEKIIKESSIAIKSGDSISISRLNSQFHTILAEAVDNEIMGAVVADLELRLRRYFIAVDWAQRNESIAQHKAIYKAIHDRDAARAKELTIAHLAHTEALARESMSFFEHPA